VLLNKVADRTLWHSPSQATLDVAVERCI